MLNWNLIKCFFYESIEAIMCFLFFILLAQFIWFIWFWALNRPCFSGVNLTWIYYMIFWIWYWIWFVNVLLRDHASRFIKNMNSIFFLCCFFLWFGGQKRFGRVPCFSGYMLGSDSLFCVHKCCDVSSHPEFSSHQDLRGLVVESKSTMVCSVSCWDGLMTLGDDAWGLALPEQDCGTPAGGKQAQRLCPQRLSGD